MSQLALRYEGRPQDAEDWESLRRLLREVVDFVGVKTVAYDLDIAPSSLVQALDGHDRHHVRASWLPYLIRKAPNAAVVELMAGLKNMDVVPQSPPDPAEELKALTEALTEELGPAMRAALLDKARRRRR